MTLSIRSVKPIASTVVGVFSDFPKIIFAINNGKYCWIGVAAPSNTLIGPTRAPEVVQCAIVLQIFLRQTNPKLDQTCPALQHSSSLVFYIVVPCVEAVVGHLTNAQMDITHNTTEVGSLDVTYSAATLWMLVSVRLAHHLLFSNPTVTIIRLARFETGHMLRNIDQPLSLC